jgi:hypothetical protein
VKLPKSIFSSCFFKGQSFVNRRRHSHVIARRISRSWSSHWQCQWGRIGQQNPALLFLPKRRSLKYFGFEGPKPNVSGPDFLMSRVVLCHNMSQMRITQILLSRRITARQYSRGTSSMTQSQVAHHHRAAQLHSDSGKALLLTTSKRSGLSIMPSFRSQSHAGTSGVAHCSSRDFS